MRIGQGYDIHAFGPGDHVVLGGVRIAHDRGIVAHSDGDVLIHALCDALLGALALGDIGRHFPPSDARWRDADSRLMLRHVATLIAQRGYRLGNADVTVICEQPRIAAHAAEMCRILASDLDVDGGQLSVKATTSEGLGAIGRGEGIAAMAIAVLFPVTK